MFFMIFKLAIILLNVFYAKNMIFYETKLNLMENNTFNNFFCNRIFLIFYIQYYGMYKCT